MPLVVSNAYVSTLLFWLLWKIVNDARGICQQYQWSSPSNSWSIYLVAK